MFSAKYIWQSITSALAHIARADNPHAVSKAQVGLGNVDNTADADKAVSSATATALSGKASTSHTHAAADVADFNGETRAQVESELIAGGNITLTPSGSGASRQITIASAGGGATDHGALTGLSDDDHAQYHTDARGDARYSLLGHNHSGVYDPAGTASAAVSAHESAIDPHPQYLTAAEGSAAFDALGSATSSMSAHTGAADPHPQYLTPDEANAAYAPIGVTGATNLSVINRGASTLDIASDTGADATVPAATGSLTGLMSAADKTKIDAISGTNTGDQTSIVGITGTKAQFDTALSDGNFMYSGDAPTAHTHPLSDLTQSGATSNQVPQWNGSAWIPVTLSVGAATNLARGTTTATTQPITNSNGTGFTLPEATTSLAGLLNASDKTKLTNTSGTNTGDQTTIVGISGTLAQFNTAVSDADLVPTGAIGSSGLTMSTDRLLGRSTAATGDVEEITLGTNLSFTGTTLNAAGGGGGWELIASADGSGNATTMTLSVDPADYLTPTSPFELLVCFSLTRVTSGVAAGSVIIGFLDSAGSAISVADFNSTSASVNVYSTLTVISGGKASASINLRPNMYGTGVSGVLFCAEQGFNLVPSISINSWRIGSASGTQAQVLSALNVKSFKMQVNGENMTAARGIRIYKRALQ